MEVGICSTKVRDLSGPLKSARGGKAYVGVESSKIVQSRYTRANSRSGLLNHGIVRACHYRVEKLGARIVHIWESTRPA